MDRIERERLLFLYSGALEHGDMETISDVLHHAETDALLGEMIREINAMTLRSAPVAASTRILAVAPTRDAHPSRRWPGGLAISAAALVTSIIFVLLLLGLPQMREETPTGAITGRPILTRHNVKQIAPVAHIGNGSIYDLAWSPDSRTLAVASATGLHYFAGDTLQTQTLPQDLQMSLRVQAVDFSADGSQIALLTRHGIDIAYADTGEPLDTKPGAYAEFVRFAPHDRLITGVCDHDALTCTTFDIVLVDGDKSRLIVQDSNLKPVLSDDRRLLATSDGQHIYVWDTGSDFGVPLIDLRSPQSGPIKAMQFDAGSTQISAQVDIGEVENPRSSAGTTVLADALITWDVNSGEILHQATLLDPSSTTFYHEAGGDYRSYELRESRLDDGMTLRPTVLADGSELFSGDSMFIEDASFSPDDERLALLLEDGRLAMWSLLDSTQPALTGILDTFFSSVDQIAFSPVNTLLAVGNALRLNVYDFAVDDFLHAARFQQAQQRLPVSIENGFAFGPDGALAYADAEPGRSSIAFWKPDDGVTVAATGALDVADAAAIHYDSSGTLLAYFADSQTLVRRHPDQVDFTVESLSLPFTETRAHSVHSVFSQDGRWLAIDGCLSAGPRTTMVCDDFAVTLVETVTGNVMVTVSTGFAGPGRGMAVGTGADDGRVLLAVSGCMNYSDGTLLDAVCTKETIAVWNLTGIVSGTNTQPEALSVVDGAGSVAFNPGATLLAFANERQIQIINVATGDILFTQAHNSNDTGLAFHPENTLLAVGDGGSILLYGVPLD